MGQAKDAGGVWGHSSETATEQYVIFCIDVKTPEDHAHFKHWLTGHSIGFKSLIGSYKGLVEPAYIVNGRDMQEVYDTELLLRQESVLHLGIQNSSGRRPAILVYQEFEQSIGWFHDAPRHEAVNQEGWTFDPSTGLYYIVTDKAYGVIE
jgi:hypothetical protein